MFDLGRKRWHAWSADQGVAIGVYQGQTGNPGLFNIGRNFTRGGRRHVAGALRRCDKQISKIACLRSFVRNVGSFTFGQGEFRHVELQGRVFRKFAHDAKLLVCPFVDIGGTAVGDDAKAHLPGRKIAASFVFNKLEGEEHGSTDEGNHGQANAKHHLIYRAPDLNFLIVRFSFFSHIPDSPLIPNCCGFCCRTQERKFLAPMVHNSVKIFPTLFFIPVNLSILLIRGYIGMSS